MNYSHVRIDMHESLSAGGDMLWYYRVSLVGRLKSTENVPCDPYVTPYYKANTEWFCVLTIADGLLESRYAESIAEAVATHYKVEVIDSTED